MIDFAIEKSLVASAACCTLTIYSYIIFMCI